MNQWKIKDTLYHFPKSWDKDKVIKWVNTDIKMCENCGKIDAPLNHFKNCNQEEQRNRDYNINYKY